MSYFASALMALFLLTAVFNSWIEVKIKSPYVVFPLGLVAVFFVPFFILAPNYSPSTQIIVALWAVSFLGSYVAFRLFFVHALKISWAENIDSLKQVVLGNSKVLTCAFSSMLLLALLASFYQFDFSFHEMVNTSWSERRKENDSGILHLIAQYLVYSASGCVLVLWFRTNKFLFLLFLVSLVYYVFIIKTRSFFVALTVPFLVYFIVKNGFAIKSYIPVIVLLIGFMFVFVLTRSVRHSGGLINIVQDPSLLVHLFVNSDLGEFRLLDAFFFVVERGEVNPDFDENSGFVRLCLMFFPDFLVSDIKPKDISHSLWDSYVGVTGVGGSFHATVVADSYLNDHDFGFLFYPFFYAFMFSFYERLILFCKLLWIPAFAISAVCALVIVRGAVYNGFAILLMTSIFWVFVIAFFKFCRVSVSGSGRFKK